MMPPPPEHHALPARVDERRQRAPHQGGRRLPILLLLLLLLGTLFITTTTAGDAPPGVQAPAAVGVVLPFGSEPDLDLAAPPKGGWTPKAFPNPVEDPVSCGRPAPTPTRPHGSWMCDPDGVLSPAGADAVEGVLRDIASARSPFGSASCGAGTRSTPGFQVAVALVDKLAVKDGLDAASAAAAFAKGVMDAWGVGAAGCNDGTVLVLSRLDKQVRFDGVVGEIESRAVSSCGVVADGQDLKGGGADRGESRDSAPLSLAPPSAHHHLSSLPLPSFPSSIQVYILAGAGATPTLPPASSSAIIAAMAPRLRASDWDGAVRQALADVGLTLSGAAPPDAGPGGGFDWGLVLFGAIFAGIAGSGLRQAASRRREVGAVRGLLAKLRREQEGAAAAAAYPAESCPICLDDFAPPSATASPAPGVVPASMASIPSGGRSGRDCCDTGAAAPSSAPLLGGGGLILTPSPPAPLRRPLALPCGHTFCEPCLTRWLDGGGHTTCPICRAAVTTAGVGAATTTTATTQAQPPPTFITRRPWDPDLYAPELLFRLGSVRRLYPALVGVEVLDSWARAVSRGERPSAIWADEARDFALHDGPTARRQAREGGAWGASSGFGGGGSAGASGAGGTW